MNIDQMDSKWIATIGPNGVTYLLRGKAIEMLGWVRTAYSELKDSSITPISIAVDTPMGNRFSDMFSFLNGICAGSKLISSHVVNREYGNPRSYSVIVLSRTEKPGESEAGRPFVIMDGAEITAARTTLGACLVAQEARSKSWLASCRMAYIGCGRIARSLAAFWAQTIGSPIEIRAFDTDPIASKAFIDEVTKAPWHSSAVQARVAVDITDAVDRADVVCFATTAKIPYFDKIGLMSSDALIFHLSLRDISEEVILANTNLVDDRVHVCTRATSLHLAKDLAKSDSFISGTVFDLLTDKSLASSLEGRVIYSPFGLAILDVYFGWNVFNEYCKQHVSHD